MVQERMKLKWCLSESCFACSFQNADSAWKHWEQQRTKRALRTFIMFQEGGWRWRNVLKAQSWEGQRDCSKAETISTEMLAVLGLRDWGLGLGPRVRNLGVYGADSGFGFTLQGLGFWTKPVNLKTELLAPREKEMRTMLFSLIPLRYEVFYGYFRLYPLNPYPWRNP